MDIRSGCKKVLAWRLGTENEHELEMPLPEKEYVSCPQVFGLKKSRSVYVRMFCDQIYFDRYELLYSCLLLLPHFIRTDTITTACCFVMFVIRSCSNPFCNWFWRRVWVPKHWCDEQKLLMIEILHHPPLPGWYQITPTPSIGPAPPQEPPAFVPRSVSPGSSWSVAFAGSNLRVEEKIRRKTRDASTRHPRKSTRWY